MNHPCPELLVRFTAGVDATALVEQQFAPSDNVLGLSTLCPWLQPAGQGPSSESV